MQETQNSDSKSQREKKNIESESDLAWNDLKDKTIDESLSIIYSRINKKSREMCSWYWRSIKSKKRSSLIARSFAVFFLIIGTVLPILSAVLETAEAKLALTQLGLAMLVIAGLLTAVDKIFGWSGGWMRYIQTVTSMENLIKVYQMEWDKYIISTTKPLEKEDVISLLNLSSGLMNELIKLLSEETNKWVVEFNASISLLESTIKAQREETEKKLDSIRVSLSDKSKLEKEKKEAEEKAKERGSVQVQFNYQNNNLIKLKLKFDEEEESDFYGKSWAKLKVEPGQHILKIETVTDPVEERFLILEVKPSQMTKEEIEI